MTIRAAPRASFHVIEVGQRPLLAIPLAASAARAVQCYPGHTSRKRVIRFLIGATFHSRLGWALWARRESPVPEIPAIELQAWIEQVRRELGGVRAQPIFVWPADPKRGRLYIHWQDPEGAVVAFTKLALDQKNSALIENERETLEQLGRLQLQKSHVPRVLAAGRLREHCYAVIETAPREARITNWQKNAPIEEHVREFAGVTRRMNGAELSTLPWWRPFTEYLDGDSGLRRAVWNAAQGGVDVCRVHGDLNQTNILRTRGEIWLLDWERSSQSGPCLTDFVCMAVDRLWSVTRRNAAKGLEAFLNEMWQGQSEKYHEQVLLALTFLSIAAFPPALLLFKEWELKFGEQT